MNIDELYDTLEGEVSHLKTKLVDGDVEFKIRNHIFVIEADYDMFKNRVMIETFELERSKEIYNQFIKKKVNKVTILGRIEETGQVRFNWSHKSLERDEIPDKFLVEETYARYRLELEKYIKES